MTGAYDPQLNTLYWPVGNPGPDLIGDDRLGDNLYTDSIVALDVTTGALKWHFQFTPHDVWDYDAQEPVALVDTTWDGQPRKLIVQANRNGFFYLIDRTNGKFLSAKAFVKQTWNDGFDYENNGRPKVVPALTTGTSRPADEPLMTEKLACSCCGNWLSPVMKACVEPKPLAGSSDACR